MRKIFLGILVLVTIFTLCGMTMAQKESFEKEKPKDSNIEKIEFIHWKKDFAKSDKAKGSKPPSCYQFLTPTGVRWGTLPVSYVINPTNPQNLPQNFITTAVFNAAETWDNSTTKELMKNTYATDNTAIYGVYDHKNAIAFGNYPTTGVIAVTSIWYNRFTGKIVEFDIKFDTDFIWGDASGGNSEVMDLQNIATHELGHGVGLGDIYNTSCSEVTMYGYSTEGETTKRTLELADITGLQKLYGI